MSLAATLLLALPSVGLGVPGAAPTAFPPTDLSTVLAALDTSDPTTIPPALAGLLPARATATLEAALARQAEADRVADRLVGADLATALAVAAGEAGIAPSQAAPVPRFHSFTEAIPALAATASVPLGSDAPAAIAELEEMLSPELTRPILDLMGALVAAAGMREQAVARLAPEDLAALGDSLGAVRSGAAPDAAAVAAAAKVDFPLLVGAAGLVASASQDAARRLQEHADQWPVQPQPAGAPGPLAPNLVPCEPPYVWPPLTAGALEPVLALGSFAPNFFAVDTILSIDPGPGGAPGDCYTNNAGATNAAVPYPTVLAAGPFFPVAVAIDLAGNDIYHSAPGAVPTPALFPFSVQADTFIQGAAMVGVGLLLDVGGDDRYASGMTLLGCLETTPTPVGYDFAFLQGAAYAGVGLMADLEGEDQYNSFNTLHGCDEPTGTVPGDDVDYSVRFAQGAGALGLGILVDAGTPDSEADDAYNSANFLWADAMDLVPSGAGNAIYTVDHTQGAGAFQGVGVMVEANGDVRYNSGNTLLATPNPATLSFAPQSNADYNAYCSQGIVGLCKVFLPELCIHPGERLSPFIGVVCVAVAQLRALTGSNVVGILVDGLGNDAYNCRNSITASQAVPTTASYTAWVVQGVAGGTARPLPPVGSLAALQAISVDLGVGVHADLEGDDCYNSDNAVNGYQSTLEVTIAQGSAQGVAVAGVLTDRARDDRYNCNNFLAAKRDTDLRVQYVQGHGAGNLALGVHADVTPPQGQSADCYNSANVQASGSGVDDLTIHFSQGTGSGAVSFLPAGLVLPEVPTAIGVLVDLDSPYQDPMPSPDAFNSNNVGGGQGLLDIWVAQGAASNAALVGTPVAQGGAGLMVEVGSHNTYNFNNVGFGLGGCAFACQLDVALGSASNLADLGVFVDVSLQPCDIVSNPIAALIAALGLPPLAPVCYATIGPDDYGSPAATTAPPVPIGPSVGCEDGGSGTVAVALDLWDGWGGAFPAPPAIFLGSSAPANPAPWPGLSILTPPGLLCLDI